jgi:hypothetical protein
MSLHVVALLVAILFPSLAMAKSPFEGVWGNEEYYCGGPKCDSFEIKNGSADLTLSGLRIKVQGSRICGVWYGSASKIYRGFLVGAVGQRKALIAYGQEMDHDPAFYESKDFEHLPSFRSEREATLRVMHQRLRIEQRATDGQRLLEQLRRLPNDRQRYWGLQGLQQWEAEFLGVCLAGSNPSIERAAFGLRRPAAAHIER